MLSSACRLYYFLVSLQNSAETESALTYIESLITILPKFTLNTEIYSYCTHNQVTATAYPATASQATASQSNSIPKQQHPKQQHPEATASQATASRSNSIPKQQHTQATAFRSNITFSDSYSTLLTANQLHGYRCC